MEADRVIEKPWGKEEIIEINDHYMMKKLTMWKGHRCSLQYHTQKCETIYVLTGTLRIISGINSKDLTIRDFSPGEYCTIEPGTIHRMEAREDSVYLEASTPEIDDVVRLVDDYNRTAS
jgi:mannose-6-phosphate isomerase-like protein (cupin superfamily)